MIPILLVVTAFFQPPAPTVGDPITIRFAKPVVLDPSPSYEILSQRGDTVVIRTFQPIPFTISGRTGDVLFQNMVVPIRSVLKPNDDMKPAPLKPPRREAYPREPFYWIGGAALAAIAAWLAAAMRREKATPVIPALAPDEQFRRSVRALLGRRGPQWSDLADALREYLAATTDLGHDLTTTEVLEASGGQAILPVPGDPTGRIACPPLIATILRQGDLEKFSPWGAAAGDFESVANEALTLAPEPMEQVAA